MEIKRDSSSPPAVREPGEIVLLAEPVAPRAIAAETHDLQYNRQAPTKPEMFPYGVDWCAVALAVLILAAMLALIVDILTFPPHRPNEHARITAAKADIASLALTVEQFEKDSEQLPSQGVGLQALLQQPMNAPGWNGPYIKQLPPDPWQTPYQYRYPGVHNTGTFDLSSAGPDRKFGTVDDVVNW